MINLKYRKYRQKMKLSIPLFEWNLENYSPVVKIAIDEYDESQTVQSQFSVTSGICK